MTKKTRLRFARIATGTVMVAGASLAAAGAASAVGVDVGIGGVGVSANVDRDGLDAGVHINTTDDPSTTIPTGPPVTSAPPTSAPPTVEPPTTPPPSPTIPTIPPGTPSTKPPTKPPTGTPTTGPAPTGTPTVAPSSAAPGTGGGDSGTCTVDLDSTDCEDNTGTDAAGSKPVQQGKSKEELAHTGAAETAYLLVGAATMIAGGIGFRFLPRLAAGRDKAA
ncbi:LPXTG cell wall anchor domain-containing protein [Streptomyces sp. B1866]|uniref:LPXTG cell wall anchor domain-containing protein n=1 Tax=Streptomyces sp. B1866 TaxID=3075431 RepID=UPI00288CB4B5|nr:LPXTG cell wall anchor domain-containing protein [Streptomyces sp. B1866]MDT3399343.1 LPXTG cell wall anchor domain-containing protein [Streptomyces sp. B1866]